MRFRRTSHSPVSPAEIQLLPDAPTSPKREEGRKEVREERKKGDKEGGQKRKRKQLGEGKPFLPTSPVPTGIPNTSPYKAAVSLPISKRRRLRL